MAVQLRDRAMGSVSRVGFWDGDGKGGYEEGGTGGNGLVDAGVVGKS